MKPHTTIQFLDALKARHDLPSDYAARKILDVSKATISNYRVGKTFFDDDVALKVAALLELDPGYVLACIHEERTKRPQVKEAWHKVAQALSPLFAAGIIGGTALLTPPPSPASELAGNIHYTHRRRGRFLPPRKPQDRRSLFSRPISHRQRPLPISGVLTFCQ